MSIGTSVKTIIVLSRDDIRNQLHPRLWEDRCDQLGVGPKPDGRYPEELQILTRSVEAHY